MRILFMGTPDFAVPSLEKLIQSSHDVVGVVTQPDRPKGRGHKLTPPPAKECAQANGIPVFQPETLKDNAFLPTLQELDPDMIAVVAYGKILPNYILQYKPDCCINVHGSLLPKYRGAAPIQWSVINGDKTAGVTTMYLAKELDAGDMILQSETPVGETETAGELFDRLSVMGADLLLETLSLAEQGTAPRTSQDHTKATYAPMIEKETGHIDFNKSTREILNLIRGTDPWPGSFALYDSVPMKIIHAVSGEGTGNPGEILSADKRGLSVACKDGAILIDEIQMQGGKRMSVSGYLNGHSVAVGTILC